MDSKNFKFTEEHEWVSADNDVATIGITHYAQGELGDIVYVELPQEGEEVTMMESFGTIEAVKAVSELYSPVSGTILEKNEELEAQPELINQDAEGKGWLIKVKLKDLNELEKLMSYDEYQSFIGK